MPNPFIPLKKMAIQLSACKLLHKFAFQKSHLITDTIGQATKLPSCQKWSQFVGRPLDPQSGFSDKVLECFAGSNATHSKMPYGENKYISREKIRYIHKRTAQICRKIPLLTNDTLMPKHFALKSWLIAVSNDAHSYHFIAISDSKKY